MKRRRSARAARKKVPLTDHLADLALWALVLVVPLVLDVKAKDNFRLPKELLSEVLVLASLLFLCFRLWNAGRIDWRGVLRHPAVLAAAPLLGVATLGWWVTDHPLHVRQGWSSLLIGLAALTGWSLGLGEEKKKRLLFGMAVPAAILSLIAILQSHGVFNPFEFEGRVGQRRGLTSLAGGALDLASYLVLPALVAQIGLYRSSSRRRRGSWALVLALVLYAMARTQTLTALAALALASVVLWAVLLPPRRLAVGGTVLLVLGALMVVSVTPLRERVGRKVRRLAEGRVNTLLTGRLDGWRAALWMLERHPVLGVGVGAFTTEFAVAKLELTEAGVEFFKRHNEAHFASPHNEILGVGAECGGLGLLALGWGLWLLSRELARRRAHRHRAGDRASPDLALMLSGVAGLAVLSVAAFPMHLAIVAYPHLLLLSWILGCQKPQPEVGS